MITIELKNNGIEVKAANKTIITNKEDLHVAVDLFLEDETPTAELSAYQNHMINGCPTCE